MGRLITIISFLLTCIVSGAQDTGFLKPARTIKGSFSDFSVDNVGNIYVVNNNTLQKMTSNGDSAAVYNDVKRYGKISGVDAGNPLRILVHYAETSTIVVLDRFLSVRNVIDLRKNNIHQVKAVCLSYDNNIWLYDELNGKIRKIDDNGKVVLESVDLRNVFGTAPSFQKIFDESRSLYLYDPLLGWYVFDYYGAFSKKYPFTTWKDVQVFNGQMTGRSDSFFVVAKQGAIDFKKANLPVNASGAIKVQFANKHWYIQYPDKLEIFIAR
jgi:hypothetical protein